MFAFTVSQRRIRTTILKNISIKRYLQQCRTLQPRLFDETDVLDISNRSMPSLEVEGEIVRMHYSKSRETRLSFPGDTHGFLYYHHEQGTPASSGEIRFRITPRDDIMNFNKGTDLTTPNYIPWSLSLFRISNATHLPFKNLLLREGLVEEALVESMAGKASRCHKRPLHYLQQPFVLDLQSNNFMLKVFNGKTLGMVRFQWPFRDSRIDLKANPYSGHVLLRLERSTLPEHANSRIIVVRVLKILEELEVVIPGYDMRLPMPEEGKLLNSMKKDHRTISPYIVNLDKPPCVWKNLNLLLE